MQLLAPELFDKDYGTLVYIVINRLYIVTKGYRYQWDIAPFIPIGFWHRLKRIVCPFGIKLKR